MNAIVRNALPMSLAPQVSLEATHEHEIAYHCHLLSRNRLPLTCSARATLHRNRHDPRIRPDTFDKLANSRRLIEYDLPQFAPVVSCNNAVSGNDGKRTALANIDNEVMCGLCV